MVKFDLSSVLFRIFYHGQAPKMRLTHRMSQSEVTIMWFNNGNNDCSCLWLIIIVILLCCCCGNSGSNNCGCSHHSHDHCNDDCTCC